MQSRMESLGVPYRSRAEIEHSKHAFMDEWGREVGLKPVDDVATGEVARHPFFPDDLELLDWTPITGEKSMSNFVERANHLAPFGKLSKDAEAVGLGAIRGNTPLPASPYEIIAYNKMSEKAKIRFAKRKETERLKYALDAIQTVWVGSVLLNPATAVRSHLDETIRFFENNGASTALWNATVPTGSTRFGGLSSEARGFVRNNIDNVLTPSRSAAWEMVNPGQRGMWVHAERWVNGGLVNNPQFKAYARAVGADDTDAVWRAWWNETGHKLSTRTTIGAGETSQEITSTVAFKIIDDSYGLWLKGAKQADQAEIRARILDAAAGGKPISGKDAQFWRRVGEIPAEINQGGSGLEGAVDYAFHVGYGAPQNGRAGAFYDHFYDWKRNTLIKANQGTVGADGTISGGRVLNEGWLMKNVDGMTEVKASEMIAAGSMNPRVRVLVKQRGLTLEKDIHEAAMQYAATQADDMMYTFGASSVAGRAVARIYPFGRAQLDYYQWWWKKLTQPTQFVEGVSPALTRGALNPLARVNVRLVDRMAHLLNLGTPGEKSRVPSPAGVIDQLTFLPNTIDGQMAMEMGPGVGAIPGWMVNLPGVPEEARDAFHVIHPSHALYTEPYRNVNEVIKGISDSIIPKGGLSVWREADWLRKIFVLSTAYLSTGINPLNDLTPEQARELNKRVEFLDINLTEKGTWYDDQRRVLYAEWRAENMHIDPLSQEYEDAMQDLEGEAFRRTLEEDLTDFPKKMIGVPQQGGSDFQYVNTLLPIQDFLDGWVEDPDVPVTDAQRDSIVLGVELVDSGKATVEDRRKLADQIVNVLRLIPRNKSTEFYSKNIGAVINLIPSREVDVRALPDDIEAGIVGTRITASGNDGFELRQRGRKEGWYPRRDDYQIDVDTGNATNRIYKNRLKDIYEESINSILGLEGVVLEWGDSRKVIMDATVDIPASFWEDNGPWLTPLLGYTSFLPDEAVAAWEAGQDFPMTVGAFKALFADTRDNYFAPIELDDRAKGLLNRIGAGGGDASALLAQVSNLEGFEDLETRPLSYYGRDLVDDLETVTKMFNDVMGWDNPGDWNTESTTDLIVNEVNLGPAGPIAQQYKDEFTSRLGNAVAISQEKPNDENQLTPTDYDLYFGRDFGPLNYEAPNPPPLSELTYAHTTTPDRVDVVDGDTIKIMGDEGPTFFRIIGIHAPEYLEDGHEEAKLAFRELIDNAETVSLGIWEPDTYGRVTSSFTSDGKATVIRDRPLVWLYIDGTVVYDPNVFSPLDIRGVAPPAVPTVPDYQGFWERERGT